MVSPLAVVGLLSVGCNMSKQKSAGSQEARDRLCLDLLKEPARHRDARKWMREARAKDIRIVGEQPPDDSRQIVDTLYKVGALDVQVVDVEDLPGLGQTTNTLVVSLPAEPAARQKLFRFEA